MTEKKRLILAMILCGAVLLIHVFFVAPHFKPKPSPEPILIEGGSDPSVTPKDEANDEKPADTTKEPSPDPQETVTPTEAPKPPEPETVEETGTKPEVRNDLVLDNEWLHTEWTSASTGACTLIEFRKEFYADRKKAPLKLLGSYPEVRVYTKAASQEAEEKKEETENEKDQNEIQRRAMILDLKLVDPEIDLGDVAFQVVSASEEKIVFEGTVRNESGPLLKVVKTVWLPKDRFEIAMDVTFTNVSTGDVSFQYDIGAAEALHIENPRQPMINVRTARWRPQEVYAVRDRSYGKLDRDLLWIEPSVKDQDAGASVLWAGLANKYFALLLLNQMEEGSGPSQLMLRATGQEIRVPVAAGVDPLPGASVRMVSAKMDLQPGETCVPQHFVEYAGPRRSDVTAQYERYGFEFLYDTGIFSPFSKVLMFMLYKLEDVTHNYGVAIILLTVIIRVLLHPLTKKSQLSMYKMQKLQPKIRELQTKYKGDKQKLAAEQMKMMRESGASPLSGCLPMLVQIPNLIGLYQGLNAAFELRHAPFMLWIQDLSEAETIFTVGSFQVHLLPILMTVAMYLQQVMTPQSPDPQTQQQMKLMRFMPLIFAVMFYSLPSGLCLYWFVSTLLGMLDQWVINRHLKRHESQEYAAAS